MEVEAVTVAERKQQMLDECIEHDQDTSRENK